MGRGTSRRAWVKLAIGAALVLLPMYLFSTHYGSGPTFPPSQLYTWPVSVVGGVVVGYAIADLVPVGEGRVPEIGLALVGGMFAWTGQLVIQAFLSTAVDLFPSAVNSYPTGLVIAGVVIAFVEVWDRYTPRDAAPEDLPD